jgi:hypothetical protein
MMERLEDETLGRLDLDVANGYVVRALDLGFPATRGVIADRVNAHGVADRTEFYGARVVAVEVAVVAPPGERRAALDRLRAYAAPHRRPSLYYAEDDGVVRRVRLRGEQLGWPLVSDTVVVQLVFVAPDGVLEDEVESMVTAWAAVSGSDPGRAYARAYDLSYPAASTEGTSVVTNGGTENAAPVLRLHGPCENPAVANLATGEEILFSGLALTAEQFVEVDVREATVRLNGRADQSLYGRMDLARSSLFWLAPGENPIRYSPANFGTPSRAEVIFRSAWL